MNDAKVTRLETRHVTPAGAATRAHPGRGAHVPEPSVKPATPPPLPRTPPATAARQQSPGQPHKPGDNALQAAAAVALLKLQSDMREARTPAELAYFVVNEPRQILRAQQIVFLERGSSKAFAVRAVSSVTHVDRSSPLVLWFEGLVKGLARRKTIGEAHEVELSSDKVGNGYPLRHMLWVPWLDRTGEAFAGMLLARTTPWPPADIALVRHVAGAFSHAWSALSSKPWRAAGMGLASRRTWALAVATAAAVMAVPVSMTALAPVEVVPRDPIIVTSGVEGVVRNVLVEPNASVQKGQVVVSLADTVLKNRLEIAEREVGVAETKYKKAAQLAFVDVRGRHELAEAQAELALKMSERDYARDLLERAEIKAERDGMAFFGDRKDLIGRPVAVGEKLMEIASPADVAFQVDLGVADAIVLHERARVRVYLDSDPLNPIEARLVRAGYQARVRENQQLAFRLVAEADPTHAAAARLGVRGTAQVYSDSVPLGFYLFRRPIAAARQWLGL